MEAGEDGVGKVVRRESAACWIVESNVGGNVGYMGLGIGGGGVSSASGVKGLVWETAWSNSLFRRISGVF